MAMRMISYNHIADDASKTAPLLLLPSEGGGGSASVNPDPNVFIVLAVVFCVLICALVLNYLLRDLAMGAIVELNKRKPRKIPVVEYEISKAGLPGTECAICLGKFVDGEMVRLLPTCHHDFHVRCIDGWLAEHLSCPICRNSLMTDDHGAGEATVTGEEAT